MKCMCIIVIKRATLNCSISTLNDPNFFGRCCVFWACPCSFIQILSWFYPHLSMKFTLSHNESHFELSHQHLKWTQFLWMLVCSLGLSMFFYPNIISMKFTLPSVIMWATLNRPISNLNDPNFFGRWLVFLSCPCTFIQILSFLYEIGIRSR